MNLVPIWFYNMNHTSRQMPTFVFYFISDLITVFVFTIALFCLQPFANVDLPYREEVVAVRAIGNGDSVVTQV